MKKKRLPRKLHWTEFNFDHPSVEPVERARKTRRGVTVRVRVSLEGRHESEDWIGERVVALTLRKRTR